MSPGPAAASPDAPPPGAWLALLHPVRPPGRPVRGSQPRSVSVGAGRGLTSIATAAGRPSPAHAVAPGRSAPAVRPSPSDDRDRPGCSSASSTATTPQTGLAGAWLTLLMRGMLISSTPRRTAERQRGLRQHGDHGVRRAERRAGDRRQPIKRIPRAGPRPLLYPTMPICPRPTPADGIIR